MNDFFRENRDLFVDTEPETKVNAKLFAMNALNPFIEHNSSARGLMMSSHIAQTIVMENPEEDMLQTGLEYELGKYAILKKLETDAEIISIIKRGDDTNPSMTVVIYKDLDTGVIDCVEIPYFNAFHPYFGFKFNHTEKLALLNPGDIVEEDTILAKPKTVKDDGGYGFGRDVNIAIMSIPEVDEDGFVVSESLCKDFKFKIFETKTIDISENDVLLNLYGDEENYKPFPDINEYIRETGEIIGSREINARYGPSLYSRKDLMEINPIFDDIVYGRSSEGYKRGKVIDIKVYKNFKRKPITGVYYDQCQKYADEFIDFHRQIINVYDSLERSYNRTNRELIIGNTLTSLITESLGIVESENRKYKKIFRNEPIGVYRVEITVEYERVLYVKNKLSDKHGGKGTIVEVWPDEDMPIDEDGNRADIIADPKATISRLNIGRLYERYTKAGIMKANKIIKDEFYKLNKDIYKLELQEVKYLFNIILEFTSLIGNEQYKVYSEIFNNNDRDSMLEVIDEAITDKLRIYLTVDNEKRKYEIINELQNSIFNPPYKPVKYRYAGKDIVTKRPILIAPLYIILLSKIADTSLSTASAKLNSFGLPVVISNQEKSSLPYRNSPVRVLGETESRLFAAYGGRKLIAELRDINVSTESHKLVYNKLLTAPNPVKIDKLIDRDKHPYGTEKALNILTSVWNSVGMGLKYLPDENVEYEYTGNVVDEVVDIDEIKDLVELGLADGKDEDA